MTEDPPVTRAERQRARQNGQFGVDANRALPASEEAEKGVLCSIMRSPDVVLGLCVERGVKSDWFHSPARSILYGLMSVMWMDGDPIDLVTVTTRLAEMDQFQQADGARLHELFDFVPTAANADWYLGILQEKHTLRCAIKVGTEYVSRAYEAQEDVPALLDAFERDTLSIRPAASASRLTDNPTAIRDALDRIQAQIDRKGVIPGIATGFPEWDALTGGLQRQELTVIGARPSMGKTALAMNVAEHVACAVGLPVAVFSLEMSTRQILDRLLCSIARVDLAAVRDGKVDGQEQQRLAEAAEYLGRGRIYYDDTPALPIQQLTAKARRLKQQFGIEAIFVDYLQLLKSTTRRREENRQQEVAEVSAGLKAIAKELDVPLVALAQIGRQFEERASKGGRPRLSDLRESGAIEQDADNVALLNRDEMWTDDPQQKRALNGKADLIFAKTRNGPLGDIPLTFLKQYTKFLPREVNEHEEADAQQALLDVPAQKKRRKRGGEE